MKFLNARILKFGSLTTVGLLLSLLVPSIRTVGSYFMSASTFISSLPLPYYVAYYFTIALILVYALTSQEKKSSDCRYGLALLLIFAFLIDFPRYLFTNPFQREAFPQAQVFHVLSYGSLSYIPPHSENVLNPIFWGIFIEVASLQPFETILYFAPTFMLLLTVLSIFMVLKRISSPHLAFIGTFFFLSFFFELYFTNRYAYASPLFVLFIGRFIVQLIRPDKSNAVILLLLIPAIIIGHVGHATLMLAVTILFMSLSAWNKLRATPTSERMLGHTQNIALLSFLTYGFWYFVENIRLHGLKIWLNAFMDILRKGFFEIGLIEAVHRLPLEPAYGLIVQTRIVATLIAVVICLGLAVFYLLMHTRGQRDVGKMIRIGAASSYFLFLMPLGVGAVAGIWSLRPLHLLLLFSPFLIALLLPRRLFKPILIVATAFSLIIVYSVWVPNLGYVQVPDRKVQLIKFASVHIPENQAIGGVGTDWIEQTLFTHIFSNRVDLRLSSICDLFSDECGIIAGKEFSFVVIDPSIEKYEAKYVIEPSLHERVHLARDALIEEHFNIVYDGGNLYNLLHGHVE